MPVDQPLVVICKSCSGRWVSAADTVARKLGHQTFWICRLSAISVPSSTEYLENTAASLALTNTTGTPSAFSLRSPTVTFPDRD